MFRSPKDVTVPQPDVEKKLSLRTLFKTYECVYCNQGPWSTEVDLQIHRETRHKHRLLKLMKDDNSNICTLCLQVLGNRQTLIEHIKVTHLCCAPNATHIHRNIFICEICERIFFNKKLLITHIQSRHHNTTTENKVFNCPRCMKVVRNSGAWYHFLSHGLFSSTACPICLTRYEHTAEMLEHLKSHPFNFTCNICGFETLREVYLKAHFESHKKKAPEGNTKDVSKFFVPYAYRYRCEIWKQRFTSLMKGIPLSQHFKICVLCRKICTTEEEMRDHIYGDHEPNKVQMVKSYACSCGEEFSNKILLKQHVFRLKGEHRESDGQSQSEVPAVTPVGEEQAVIYRIYEFGADLNESTEIVIPDTNKVYDESENVDVENIIQSSPLETSDDKSEDCVEEQVVIMDES